MLRYVLLAIVLSVPANAAQAQGEAAVPDSPWSGALSVGFLSTSGNSDASSYNATFGIGYVTGNWKHSLDAAMNGADEGQQTTAESYQAGWKSEYNFTEQDFIFGTADWRKDRFSGVEQQLTQAVGYGRRLIETEKHLLNIGLGAGHRSADLADGSSENGFIGRGNLEYNWKLSETSGFDQNFVVETGSDNTYFESVSAVRARLLGDFALVLSYTIRHNSNVPAGSEKTDRLSAISVEYAF